MRLLLLLFTLHNSKVKNVDTFAILIYCLIIILQNLIIFLNNINNYYFKEYNF